MSSVTKPIGNSGCLARSIDDTSIFLICFRKIISIKYYQCPKYDIPTYLLRTFFIRMRLNSV